MKSTVQISKISPCIGEGFIDIYSTCSACSFILVKTSNIKRILMPFHEQPNGLKEFCKDILSKDLSIRFAAVANQMGILIESEYREGLKPLMNRQETEHYTMQTVFRASTRETFENKIGKQRYAIAVYEKVIRATIPIIVIGSQEDKDGNQENKQQQQQQQQKEQKEQQNSKWIYLLVSFDLGSDVISIMEDKILPSIEQFRKHSLAL